MEFGLTLSSEEHPPRHLIETAVAAEQAGFDFVSISDHFHPWIDSQGHSPFVWSVLGAIAEATEDIDAVVGVTCPTVRIHPAILAQAAATTAMLLEGRFTWGVGSGEALNEHILGHDWPPAPMRLEMLREAVEVIRALWKGDSVTFYGDYYTVEDARIYDLPETLPPIVVSAFGEKAAKEAADYGDGLWTTGIQEEVLETYRSAGGTGPVYSQLSVCWAESRDAGIKRTLETWPNTALPGQLAQDLRTPAHFEQAVQLVSRAVLEDSSLPMGPEPDPIIEAISDAREAGIDHIYIHQIGDPLDGFIDFWTNEISPEVRAR